MPTAHRERSPRRRARRASGRSGPLEETRPGLRYTAECKVFLRVAAPTSCEQAEGAEAPE